MKSLLSYNETLQAVSSSHVFSFANENEFSFLSVATDSRNCKAHSLFVPLLGEKQNGHEFIESAIANGARVVFVAESELESDGEKYKAFLEKYREVFFVVVRQTLYALQNLARFYVEKFPHLKKIGITGSSGKTTTKELLVALLKKKYRVVYNEGNLNSETGLPLSVFKITDADEVGVFEMGMNRENEIAELATVLKPNVALITNIGSAHIGILGSKKNIANEKRKIFSFIKNNGAAFIPNDDEFKNFLAENVKGKIIFFGEDEKLNLKKISSEGFFGTTFSFQNEIIHFPIAGIHNFKNALAAIFVANFFGVNAKDIKAVLENVSSVAGRTDVQKVLLKNNFSFTLVNDCYNANPESMRASILLCEEQNSFKQKLYVLGDMKELGEVSFVEHKKLGALLSKSSATIFFVGNEMKAAFDEARKLGLKNAKYFSSSDEKNLQTIAEFILKNNFDFVLLKASNSMNLGVLLSFLKKEEAIA